MSFIDLFAQYVPGFRAPNGKQATGKCLWHDDAHASWSANLETGAWHCFSCNAKGSAGDFAKRVGEHTDRPEQPQRKASAPATDSDAARMRWNQHDPECTYDYTDMHGTALLYQVGRFLSSDGSKFFLPRVPDMTKPDGWRYSLEGVARVLYRLPEVSPARHVFYVEGEKCVEALRRIGCIATTHAGGALGTVSPAMLEPLKKKHVVLLPDNDTPGQQMGARIQAMLTRIAATVKVVSLPHLAPKGDIVDWLDAGHTGSDLQNLICESPVCGGTSPWVPELTIFARIERKPIHWNWYPYLPEGRITICEGDPGVGKSWFCTALAASVSLGAWPFQIAGGESLSTPAGVVYVNNEDDPEDTLKGRLDAVGADQQRVAYLSGKRGPDGKVLPITLADLDVLAQAVERMRAKLLMIDPIQAHLPDSVEMHRAEKVRPMLMGLQRLAKAYGCTVLLVRHLAKGSKDKALYQGMGSIDFTAAARSVLVFAERLLPPQPHGILSRRVGVAQIKNNLAPKGPTLEYETKLNAFAWVGTVNITAEELLAGPAPGSLDATKENDAKQFLITELQQGSLTIDDLRRLARSAGLNFSAVTNAKNGMNIDTEKTESGEWIWSLRETGKYRKDH